MSVPAALGVARVRAGTRALEWIAPLAVFGLAAGLRFAGLARTPLNPFYDAAVRAWRGSWHAFAVGAFEPSAALSIDKPPLDLWLQVASVKVFGFGPLALLLPAALGGTLAVVALHDLLKTLMGARVALAGAFALAVLPVAVITSRSDTMDSVMAAILVAAFAVAARGLRQWQGAIRGRRRSAPRPRLRGQALRSPRRGASPRRDVVVRRAREQAQRARAGAAAVAAASSSGSRGWSW